MTATPTPSPNDGASAAAGSRPQLAVVVPVHNESDNIAVLIAEIRAALDGRFDYEIVYVDDASTDSTASELANTAATCPNLRVVRHRQRSGQSAAVATGVTAARAPVIATLDGDGQNDPADIPALVGHLLENADPDRLLVAGMRAKRKDTAVKRLSSRIANGVRRRLLGDGTPDTGCGLKVFSRDAFLAMPRFDHMHRFLPALMLRQKGDVVSVAVNHRPRAKGATKYGVFDRLWVGITDLFGVLWLLRRAIAPQFDEIDTGQDRGDAA